jgi:hypothetical protein
MGRPHVTPGRSGVATRRGRFAILLLVGFIGVAARPAVPASTALTTDGETVPATFTTAGTFPGSIAFVKLVGSDACGGTSSVVTVPAGGVAAGNTLVLSVVVRGNSTGAVSVSDSKGNTYSLDVTSTRTNQGRTFLFSARVATALISGNTITVSHPNDNAEGVIVAEFSGIAASSRVDVTAATHGNNASPTGSVTTTGAPRLVVGAVGNHYNVSFTEASGWTTLLHLPQTCAGGPNRADHHAAYRIESASGTFTYDPSLETSQEWYEAVAAYR